MSDSSPYRNGATGRGDCNHETLFFGSGDYYVICRQCYRQWVTRCVDSDHACSDDPNGSMSGEERVKP